MSNPVRNISRRAVRLCIGVVTIVSIAALFAFVFPTRALMNTRDERDRLSEQVEAVNKENEQLQREAKSLETDAAVERLARDSFGLVMPGETAYSVRGPAEETADSSVAGSTDQRTPASTP